MQFTDTSPLQSGSARSISTARVEVQLDDQWMVQLLARRKPMLGLFGGGGTEHSQYQWGDGVPKDPSDPDSPAVGATLYVLFSSFAAGSTQSLTADDGAGSSSGPDMATEYADRIEIDTGAARFVLARDGSILQELWQGTQPVLTTGAQNGLYVVDETDTTFTSRDSSTTVTLVENGPIHARISYRGLMSHPQAGILTDYELLLSAYAGCPMLFGALEVTPGYWTTSNELHIDQIHLIAQVAGGGSPVLNPATAQQSTLASASTLKGLVHGNVTDPSPKPWQVRSMRGTGSQLGVSSVARSNPLQPSLVMASGNLLLLNVGFTSHFVSPSETFRESAEFALGAHDPVPSDLNRHGIELVHDLEGTVVQ